MAIPTTASMPSASSSSISACVVTPPAAMSGRLCGVAHGTNGGDVGALHQAFLVDVRVKKLATIWLERADGIGRSRPGRRLPPVRDDPSALAVDGADDALDADCSANRLALADVDAPSLNSAEPTMTFFAPIAHSSSARSGVRTPPPTWQGSRPHISRTRRSFEPEPIAASRSMTFVRAEPGEPANPVIEIGRFDGELFALNQLNDLAALEIDRWNEHV